MSSGINGVFSCLYYTAATSIIYPIFWVLWEILYAPIRLVLLFSNFIAFICSFICDVLGEIWQSLSGLCQLGSASRTALSTSEVSMWRSLWNDLFSQVVTYFIIAFDSNCNVKIYMVFVLTVFFLELSGFPGC